MPKVHHKKMKTLTNKIKNKTLNKTFLFIQKLTYSIQATIIELLQYFS